MPHMNLTVQFGGKTPNRITTCTFKLSSIENTVSGHTGPPALQHKGRKRECGVEYFLSPLSEETTKETAKLVNATKVGQK